VAVAVGVGEGDPQGLTGHAKISIESVGTPPLS
jgi:precorrin-6B methylase 1